MTVGKKFWMVFGGHCTTPTKRHSSYTIARDEAERLARLNPCQSFYVLEATSVSLVEQPSITKELL